MSSFLSYQAVICSRPGTNHPQQGTAINSWLKITLSNDGCNNGPYITQNLGKIKGGRKGRGRVKKRKKEARRKKKFSSWWEFWGKLRSLHISTPKSICLSGAGAWDTHHVGDELALLPAARLADRIVLDVLEWRKRQQLTERECGEGSCRDRVL